jgi:hypothetical protein
MGYDVEYQCTLYVDDRVNLTFHYSRGNGGWSGDAPPPDHEGEGLLEGLEQVYAGEWVITIKNGNVTMTLRSEKFYDNYMTRMLRLLNLKERVPSLHGYVSCDLNIYWVVTSEVRRYDLPGVHEFARMKYDGGEGSTLAHELR